MDIFLIIITVFGVAFGAIKLFSEVYSHIELEGYDNEENRSRLLKDLDELQCLEREAQAFFHSEMLESVKKVSGQVTYDILKKLAEGYYRQVKNTEEMREALLSENITLNQMRTKVIDNYIKSATNDCLQFLDAVPESLKFSNLKHELEKQYRL